MVYSLGFRVMGRLTRCRRVSRPGFGFLESSFGHLVSDVGFLGIGTWISFCAATSASFVFFSTRSGFQFRVRVPGSKIRVSGPRSPVPGFQFRVWGSGFQIPRSGFRDSGLGFRVFSFGYRDLGSWYRDSGSGSRYPGSGYRYPGSGYRDLGFGYRDQDSGYRRHLHLLLRLRPRTGVS